MNHNVSVTQKRRQAQWEGLWCPNDQPPVTAAAHPSALVVAPFTRSQPRYHCLVGHQHPINPTWHPSACSQPGRPWLHSLLNISSLTNRSQAPSATISSQLGAPSRHVGTGPGAGTAARTGSAPEFYSAQQAMLLPLQLPWSYPRADSDTRDLLKKFVKQCHMRRGRFVDNGQVR